MPAAATSRPPAAAGCGNRRPFSAALAGTPGRRGHRRGVYHARNGSARPDQPDGLRLPDLEPITMAERERQDRGTGMRAARRGARAARNVLRPDRERVPIGERVRQVHLEHFCPGGAGLPEKGSGLIGLGWADGAPVTREVSSARPAGQQCGRCGQPLTPRQDARKRVTGTWVHETCPSIRSPRAMSSESRQDEGRGVAMNAVTSPPTVEVPPV